MLLGGSSVMTQKIISFILLLALVCLTGLPFAGCGYGGDIRVTMSEEAFGTILTFSLYGSDRDTLEQLGKDLERECARLEKIFSFELKDSELSKVNALAAKEPVSVSEDLYSVLKTSLDVSIQSEHAFDIRIGRLIELWHVETNEGIVPDRSEIELCMTDEMPDFVLDDKNRTVFFPDPRIKLHLGAVAKGYLGECLGSIVKAAGCRAILNLGGNIQPVGLKNGKDLWHLAVTDPFDTVGLFADFDVGEMAVVTSGAYARFFMSGGVRYHHILDPHTGYPSDSDLESVTIIGPRGSICDALSTACFVLGSENAEKLLKSYENYEYLLIRHDGTWSQSEGSVVFEVHHE